MEIYMKKAIKCASNANAADTDSKKAINYINSSYFYLKAIKGNAFETEDIFKTLTRCIQHLSNAAKLVSTFGDEELVFPAEQENSAPENVQGKEIEPLVTALGARQDGSAQNKEPKWASKFKFNQKLPFQNSKLEDVIGNDFAKETLKDILHLPMQRPDLFDEGDPYASILLFGPPGCAKTLMVSAAANEAGIPYICVDAADIKCKFFGESEERIIYLFEQASKYDKSLIIMDEVDSIMGNHANKSEATVSLQNSLLKQITATKGKVLLIGITNKPQDIEEAFFRRFDLQVYVDIPTMAERAKMFAYLTRNKQTPIRDFKELAKDTAYFTGDNIRILVQRVFWLALKESKKSGKPINKKDIILEKRHFKKILWSSKPTMDSDSLRKHHQLRDKYAMKEIL